MDTNEVCIMERKNHVFYKLAEEGALPTFRWILNQNGSDYFNLIKLFFDSNPSLPNQLFLYDIYNKLDQT